MPPWIASSRSFSVLTIRGSSILARKPNTTTKTTVPMISSGQVGISGFCAAASARGGVISACPFPALSSSGFEEERPHEANQAQRLGQREANPHVKRDPAGRFGLAGHGLDCVADEQADADAGADGREAVPEGTEALDVNRLGGGENGRRVNHFFFPLCSVRRLGPPPGC